MLSACMSSVECTAELMQVLKDKRMRLTHASLSGGNIGIKTRMLLRPKALHLQAMHSIGRKKRQTSQHLIADVSLTVTSTRTQAPTHEMLAPVC